MSRHRPIVEGRLLISRVDDLADSLEALAVRLRRLDAQGVTLQLMDDPSPMSDGEAGALMRGLLLAADFQSRITASRLKAQVIAARQGGLFPPGRPRTLDPERVADLRAAGFGATEIAAELGVARSSAYRKLKEIEAPETRRLRSQAVSPNCRAASRA